MVLLYCTNRRKNLIGIVIILWIILTTISLFLGPDMISKHYSISHLAERQIRLNYLVSIHRSREEAVAVLLQYFVILTEVASFTKSGRNYYSDDQETAVVNYSENQLTKFNVTMLDVISLEARIILKISIFYITTFPNVLHLPRANFLPNLLDDPFALQFSYLLSKNRTGFSIALGIPTVQREKIYIISTLENLIANMNYEEQQNTIIIIHIGGSDMNFTSSISEKIQYEFSEFVDQGLIEIIAPLASYYPINNELRLELNEPLERIKWRSKENLDVSFLMSYARSKATFYVQLEDDLVTTRGFINTMKKFALSLSHNSWFMLDFSRFGSIGKMFKSIELPWLITYLQIFYYEKPIDWLISEINEIKTCDTIEPEWCSNTGWLTYHKPLFQHIGTFSSLVGKITPDKDRQFRRI